LFFQVRRGPASLRRDQARLEADSRGHQAVRGREHRPLQASFRRRRVRQPHPEVGLRKDPSTRTPGQVHERAQREEGQDQHRSLKRWRLGLVAQSHGARVRI